MMYVSRDDFMMMPDEELRGIYKSTLRMRKLLSFTPLFISAVCAILYFCAGFFYLTIFNWHLNNEVTPVILPILFFLFSFISGMLMFNDKEKTHLRFGIIITLLQFAVLAYGTYCYPKSAFSGLTNIFLDICLFSCFVGHIGVIPIIRNLDALRACPSFPFDNHRRNETYASSISGERALKYLEHASEHGVRSVDLDEIFSLSSAKKDQASKGTKPYEDDFFQQHDMEYDYKNLK